MDRCKISGVAPFLVLLLLGFTLMGCPENGENGGNVVVTPGDDDDGDGDDSDANGDGDEVDDPCAEVSCGIGEVCVEGTCIANADAGYSCAEPFDLGVLNEEGTFTKTVNPAGQPNTLNTSCSVDDQSPQAVFRFTVETPTEVTFNTAPTDPEIPIPVIVREVRVDSCISGAVETCTNNNNRGFTAQPGKTYFLIMEANQGQDINFFDLEYTAAPAICAPPGARTCSEGQIEVCFGGTEVLTHECAEGCSGDECAGNRCENALEVRSSTTFTGEFPAYENLFDTSNSPTCSTSGSTVSSPGRDLVFSLPEMIAGQGLSVSLEGFNLAVIGVMSTCSETPECIAAESRTGELSWTVPQDGSYYLFVSARASVDDKFSVSIDIE